MTRGQETLAGAARALRAGETTAAELIERAIARADALDDRVGVFLHRATEAARVAGAASDERYRRGAARGPASPLSPLRTSKGARWKKRSNLSSLKAILP